MWMALWLLAITGNLVMAWIAYHNGWARETAVAALLALLWGMVLWP